LNPNNTYQPVLLPLFLPTRIEEAETMTVITPTGLERHPGSLRAKRTTAVAVIALAASVATAAIVEGIAVGSAIEAPAATVANPTEIVPVHQPAAADVSPRSQMGGEPLGPIHAD
jgi:hypothetical protein